MEEFIVWLEEELKKRDWQPADLAKKANLGNSTVTRILGGTRKAGPDVCVSIAQALGIPAEKVFRIARLLPQTPESSPAEQDLIYSFRQLSKEQQKFVIDMLRGLQGQAPLVKTIVANEVREIAPRTGGSVPEPHEIIAIIEGLDEFERWLVYDMARWRLEEQSRRRDSSGKPRLSFDVVLRAMEAMTPTQRKWLIDQTFETKD